MSRFAFVLHPLDARRDTARRYPIARCLPEAVVHATLRRLTPRVVGRTRIITGNTGAQTSGLFIACPLSAKQMLSLPPEETYERLHACAQIARDEGAIVMGLGAFTAIVGDAGKTVAARAPLAVTTGNTYTVASALEGVHRAVELFDRDLSRCALAVVGASGSIGAVCARSLAPHVRRVHLVGKSMDKLCALASELEEGAGVPVQATTSDEMSAVLRDADVVIAVTSALDAVIAPGDLKRGAIVCDVARPRDVSVLVAKTRPDVFVFDGGVVAVPNKPNLGFNFGFPPGTVYACMAETMLLALESRAESYTVGKDITLQKVEEMTNLAKKHGFALDGMRAFERAVTDADIARVRQAAA